MIITLSDIITSALYIMSDDKSTDTDNSIYSTSYSYRSKTGVNTKVTIYVNYETLFDRLYDIAQENMKEENTSDISGIHEYITECMQDDILLQYGKMNIDYIKVTEYNFASNDIYKTVYASRNRITGEINPDKTEMITSDFYIDNIIYTLL